MDERLLDWITVCAGILGLIASAGSFAKWQNLALSSSVLAGGAIAVVNLLALRRLGKRMVEGGSAGRTTGLFGLKTIIFIGGIGLLFKSIPVHVLGLLGGLSVVVLAIMLGTLFGPAASGEDMESDGSTVGVE